MIFLDSSSVIVLRLKLDKGTVLTASSVLVVEDILSFFIPAFKTFSMDSEVLEQLQKDRVQAVQVVPWVPWVVRVVHVHFVRGKKQNILRNIVIIT